MGSIWPKNRVGSPCSPAGPPLLSVDVPQTKRNLSIGDLCCSTPCLPRMKIYLLCEVTQWPRPYYISPQTNEIAKSEVVRVALNKRTLVIEKGHQLLGVFGSGRQAVKQAANPDQQFLTNSTLFPPCHINLLNNCRKTQIILLRRPCEGKILTRNMALKQQHRTEEMVTNYTKMSWNCDRDKEKHKYNSIIPTATWLPPLSIHKTAGFEIQT